MKKTLLIYKQNSFTKDACFKCFHTTNFTNWKCILESKTGIKHLNPPKICLKKIFNVNG